MNQRLTRKDIKRDEFADVVGRSVEYAGSHIRAIAYTLGGILLAVVLVVAVHYYRAHQNDQASQELAAAMKVYQAPVGAKPADAPADQPTFPTEAARRAKAKELLAKVRKDHGSTDAADVAGLYLAQIHADEGKLDEARKLWSDFADDHKGSMLAAEARLNVIALDRRQGKGEDVVKELRAMLEKGDAPLPQDAILHELGLTLEQLHRPQEAIQSYQRILDEFPQSPFRSDAQQKVAALDPTRAPAATASPFGGGGMPAGFPG